MTHGGGTREPEQHAVTPQRLDHGRRAGCVVAEEHHAGCSTACSQDPQHVRHLVARQCNQHQVVRVVATQPGNDIDHHVSRSAAECRFESKPVLTDVGESTTSGQDGDVLPGPPQQRRVQTAHVARTVDENPHLPTSASRRVIVPLPSRWRGQRRSDAIGRPQR